MNVLIAVAMVCACAAGFFIARWALAAYERRQRRMRTRELLTPTDTTESYSKRPFGRLHECRLKEKRLAEAESHVPEMLDAVALGMRSGLSFESAFKLYASRFDDELALACRRACQSWDSGLMDRDEALNRLAEEFDLPTLSRFVTNAQRSLRFGSPMERILQSLASEARSCYRAKMEERVAKTPVKMLMPTAGLILPAMLIMMMGPVVLEFVS